MKMPSDAKLERASVRLKEIDSEIRRYVEARSHWEPGYNITLRAVTPEEWQEITRAIEQCSLPCILGWQGYHPVLAIYGHGVIQGEQPDLLLYIESPQLPLPAAQKGFEGQPDTVEALAPITHSPRNAELLEWYGFEPPKELSHYVY